MAAKSVQNLHGSQLGITCYTSVKMSSSLLWIAHPDNYGTSIHREDSICQFTLGVEAPAIQSVSSDSKINNK